MVLLQSLTLGKEEIKPDEPLSLPELMELSTELNLWCAHWWLFMAMSGFITVSPWLEAVWQWASFLSSSTVTGRWSLQQINQVPGAGDWPGLACQGDTLHNSDNWWIISSPHSKNYHFTCNKKVNSFLKIVRLMLNISWPMPRCLDEGWDWDMWQSDNRGQKLNISLSRSGSSYTLSLTPRSRRATPRHQAASQLYCKT